MDLKMDIPSDVIFLMEQLEAASYEAYVVGGCVRDSVLGNTPHDWDITTNARPEEIEAVFEAYPRIDTGKKHGTIAVIYHHDIYEITTYRSEKGYSDFRHPDEVTFETSLDADLSRRDLTINAMAYSLSTGFVDLYGGLDDLHQGIIRCVGDARQRFDEDALRMLRALRFAARFNFTVEVKTAEALHDQTLIERLAFISKERIYSELTKLMLGVNCVPVLRAFRDVIGFCVPELTMMYDCPQHNVYHRYDVYEHTLHALSAMITLDQALSDEERLILRMAILFHDAGKPAAKTTDEDGWDHFYRHEIESARLAESALKRLKAPNAFKDRVIVLVLEHNRIFTATRKAVRRMLAKLGYDDLTLLCLVKKADMMAHSERGFKELPIIDACEALIEEMRSEDVALKVTDLNINGYDLRDLGMADGPEMGRVLNTLLEEVLNEQIENDHDQLIERAKKLSS